MAVDAILWALEQDAGSPSARLVLIELAHIDDHWSKDCCPSIDDLASRCVMSTRTVSRSLRKLEERGLIVTQRGGRGGSNRYTIRPSARVKNGLE